MFRNHVFTSSCLTLIDGVLVWRFGMGSFKVSKKKCIEKPNDTVNDPRG